MSFTVDQLVIFAARSGNLPLLIERVHAGGDINYFDPEHGSALSEAIRSSDLDVLDWLISSGVDVNANHDDAVGPLEIALHNPAPEVVYRLVCAGAKLTRTARPYYRQRLDKCLAQTSTKHKNEN